MIKKLLSFLSVIAIISTVSVSCSDDDDPVVETSYDYESAIFNLEYAEDSVTIDMPEFGINQKISCKDLTYIIKNFAHSKMSSYFSGVDMFSNGKMAIRAIMDDKPVTFDATYKIQGDMISLDINLMSLKPNIGMQIPTITLAYRNDGRQMKIYAEKALLEIAVLNNPILKPKLLETIARVVNKNYDNLTEEQQNAIKKILDENITLIFSKINKLEIGFNLKKNDSAPVNK